MIETVYKITDCGNVSIRRGLRFVQLTNLTLKKRNNMVYILSISQPFYDIMHSLISIKNTKKIHKKRGKHEIKYAIQ